MQSKFEKFNKLPPELQAEIAEKLLPSHLVKLAGTSKANLAFFNPMINIRKLLHHVMRGQHDAVQSMLTDDISLMFKRGKVTDCSGREFENISGFEYALWALDKHMWAAMIACIPQNEEGKRIFEILIAQYNKVNTDGVTYRLNGQTITEQHFDFKNTIIKELQTQLDSINAPGTQNWNAINKQWKEGVGGAQKLFPMHVVDEYCSAAPFHPVPKFTSQPESSKQFYYLVASADENWFNINSKLSVDFAIYKGKMWRAMRSPVGGGKEVVSNDLDAMKALCEVRTNDFIDLQSQLEDQMTPDNHYQVSQI